MPLGSSKVHQVAQGNWKGLLLRLGVPDNFLNGKHGPCPFCGGRDRFRFDNKNGSGSYICSQCGAGSGVDFAKNFKGWDFATAAREVEAMCHMQALPKDKIQPEVTSEQTRAKAIRIWKQTKPIEPGSQADGYFRGRGIGFDEYPDSLRFHPMLPVSRTLSLPAIVAKIVDVEGNGASLHRTYLDGHRKADVPRKILKGPLPEGGCVRLSGPRESICIAEGVETALSVENLFQTPCWSVLTTAMMAKWVAPDFVKNVTIFADNDPKYGGQKAAYTLAHKLSLKGVEVNVRVPPEEGKDWNDILKAKFGIMEKEE